ncbi:YggT family protein [Dyella psychrodurans]|uniref:YggT family protein n=1 Tax=Dyella psychrodurans TaxID=1927960 RepID=A0A370XAV8_9GAMM|nr:YggT family protein [Dyella psychrodurans]RDS85401.1 YggT family protein [Dyella psychrodurans]
MPYLLNALSMLIQVAFGAIATLFLVRLLAEATRVDFHNPLSQFIYRYTNPVLAPIRRVLPNWRRINLAALLIVWLTMLLERVVIYGLAGYMPALPGLLVASLADLLDFVLLFYIIVIFGWSLLTMLSADPHQPVVRLAGTIVQPLLRPLRGKLVVGNIDFSPTVVVIILLLARMLLVAPLFDLGARLAQVG